MAVTGLAALGEIAEDAVRRIETALEIVQAT